MQWIPTKNVKLNFSRDHKADNLISNFVSEFDSALKFTLSLNKEIGVSPEGSSTDKISLCHELRGCVQSNSV